MLIFLIACQAITGLLVLVGLVFNHLWVPASFQILRLIIMLQYLLRNRSIMIATHTKPLDSSISAVDSARFGIATILATGLFADAVLISFDAQLGKLGP
jgi:hypothetical protein